MPAQRAAIANFLGVDDPYALAPFAVMQTERGPRLAAALSPPPLLDANKLAAWDANPDSDVIQIDRKTGAVMLVGDDGDWLCGEPIPRQTMGLFTDGRTYVRAWAAARLARINNYRAARVPGLLASDAPDGDLPGFVVAGQFGRITRWAGLLDASLITVDNPAMVKPLAAALLRAKRVPKVIAAAPDIRRAA